MSAHSSIPHRLVVGQIDGETLRDLRGLVLIKQYAEPADSGVPQSQGPLAVDAAPGDVPDAVSVEGHLSAVGVEWNGRLHVNADIAESCDQVRHLVGVEFNRGFAGLSFYDDFGGPEVTSNAGGNLGLGHARAPAIAGEAPTVAPAKGPRA